MQSADVPSVKGALRYPAVTVGDIFSADAEAVFEEEALVIAEIVRLARIWQLVEAVGLEAIAYPEGRINRSDEAVAAEPARLFLCSPEQAVCSVTVVDTLKETDVGTGLTVVNGKHTASRSIAVLVGYKEWVNGEIMAEDMLAFQESPLRGDILCELLL